MRYFHLSIFLIFSLFSNSQNQEAVTEEDLATLKSYRTKVAQYINPIPDSAIYYSNKIKSFSENLNHKEGIIDAYYLLGQCNKRLQQNDSAIVYFKNSLKFANEITYHSGRARAHNSLGRTYYLIGNMEESIAHCKKAIEITSSFEDEGNLIFADSHIALGTAYSRQNKMEQALVNLLVVDSVHNKTPLRPDVIAAAYQNMGNIYLELDNYDFSEKYYLKANEEFLKLPKQAAQYYLNTTNIHLGRVLYFKENYKTADSLLTNSAAYFKTIGDQDKLSNINTYLGQIKLKTNNLIDAKALFTSSFDIHKKNNQDYEAALNGIEIAKLALALKQPKTALEYLNEVTQLNIDAQNSKVQQETLNLFANAYLDQGNYKNAYTYLLQASKIKDSIHNIQSAEKIKELESIYNTEKKEQEINLLKSENELIEQERKNQRNTLLSILGITAIAGLFLFILYRNRQKTNTKLKELDKAKSNFFANISHEFRTPLTLISNPIDDAIEDPSLSEKKKAQFKVAKRHSNHLLSLVNQLLDLSKIDAGQLKLRIQKSNITNLVSALAESFTYTAQQNQIDYTVTIEKTEEEVWFDKDALEKITINLLSNAIKYTPKNGSVACNSYIKNDIFHLIIKNTGEGLTEEELKHIFQRFYQTNDQNQGTGIGLALVKELVELHKGKVLVDSTPNKWTTFTITLPIDKSSFKNEQLSASQEFENNFQITDHQTLELDEEFTENNQPILLIVEDNLDVRTLLKQTFESSYNILTAANGEEGISLALEHIPDIIISDIMMPVKDGIELTNTLKNDERTSHIPIVLLTAKAGEENELEGITIGADDYITKPFSSKILTTKISKLIESRRQLQKRYSQEVILKPKDITLNNIDEQFLERVQTVLDEKLVESSFSIEDFSKAVGMSRMQLHRKLKALTGLSASEFVRSQRLKLAAQLLKKSDINISQVGYSVGFNDHAYFSKCFKDMYHCTPTEYQKKHHTS